MKKISHPILIGDTLQQWPMHEVAGEYVPLLGETFYKISDFDGMPPFFMSLVSSSNHWMFIASTGGLTAGRVNADQALFPYCTVDKITDNSENTGAKAIFLVERNGKTYLWEPFSIRQHGVYAVQRNLYKNIAGTALVFEEINHSLGLMYRYAWRTSDRYGFVKSSWLVNSNQDPCRINVLDGLQNILPANTPSDIQNKLSSLLDAYKHNELILDLGIGIFALNSKLTDLAEPSESLLANTVWQIGLDHNHYLLSSKQVDAFRAGQVLETEAETRGLRGAYFVHAVLEMPANTQQTWHLVAEVSQDAAAIVRLQRWLSGDRVALLAELERDLATNSEYLKKIVASADGLQVSQNKLLTSHHFANVMFNEMRGGYFPDQYIVNITDFVDYVNRLNRFLLEEQSAFFAALPKSLTIDELRARAQESGSADLMRLTNAYLPLAFSRRHGDPSRPWNRFTINIKKKDGSQQFDYEGNWRDIFQNWEALAYSYPEYIENMISVFLNATTVDGYNPYRITRHGLDWELPEPHNPWANIGYWSDHQIIYLLKLMEISCNFHPGFLQKYLDLAVFSYANVPYRIKTYQELLNDPYNTIDFHWELQKTISDRVQEQGADGKLVQSNDGQVLHATMGEKLLVLLLAKLVNFVPEGGIWMNTQRPEWNDANNALVGKGLSIVTLAYLRRYIVFVREMLARSDVLSFAVQAEVEKFFGQIYKILKENEPVLQNSFTEAQRRDLMDALGQAGSDYRWNTYQNNFSGQYTRLPLELVTDFLDLALRYCDHTLRANRRNDHLYHAYNILHLGSGVAKVSHLYEMLEGQVAILSSGLLNGAESLALLESMRQGPLFRPDQHSYILYPDRVLKGFVERNRLLPEQVAGLSLVNELVRAGDESLLVCDENGDYHFAGHIHNLKDVYQALDGLKQQPKFHELVPRDTAQIEALFEQTFHHDQFTGRSGTFFAYEGLGSIYWHMVSKLLLAVQETIYRTKNEPTITRLIECYADIRAGQCFNKTPAEYGAFPTDPYSHTPAGQGAKQPGMTGMVKEEVLARFAELGVVIADGRLGFDLLLLDQAEFLQAPETAAFINVHGQSIPLELPAGTLAYSICQVPVILKSSSTESIAVFRRDGSVQNIDGHWLDAENSQHIFCRDGIVHHLEVNVHTNSLLTSKRQL